MYDNNPCPLPFPARIHESDEYGRPVFVTVPYLTFRHYRCSYSEQRHRLPPCVNDHSSASQGRHASHASSTRLRGSRPHARAALRYGAQMFVWVVVYVVRDAVEGSWFCLDIFRELSRALRSSSSSTARRGSSSCRMAFAVRSVYQLSDSLATLEATKFTMRDVQKMRRHYIMYCTNF